MTDSIHALSLIASVASICCGAYLLAGSGAALCVFGAIMMVGVVYARTRAIELRTRQGMPDARDTE